MYDRIFILNFRGLRDLSIENLGRVNLLVGANNVGKTSVLEALALLRMHYNFYEIHQIAESRGYVHGQSDIGLFSGMFGEDERGQISVIGHDASSVEEVFLFDSFQSLNQSIPGSDYSCSLRGQSTGEQLVFRYEKRPGGFFGNHLEGVFRVGDWPAVPKRQETGAHGNVAFVPGFVRLRTRDMPEFLTDARRHGRLNSLIDAIRTFDPTISDMAAAATQGGWSVDVYASRAGGNVVFPLSGLGTGTHRLWEMLISLPRASGGVALIDEVDAGIYADRLRDVWSSVGRLQRAENLQIFATTHSWECVEAALTAFDGEYSKDFRLIRLERDGDDVRAITAEHHQVESAVALGFDVR